MLIVSYENNKMRFFLMRLFEFYFSNTNQNPTCVPDASMSRSSWESQSWWPRWLLGCQFPWWTNLQRSMWSGICHLGSSSPKKIMRTVHKHETEVPFQGAEVSRSIHQIYLKKVNEVNARSDAWATYRKAKHQPWSSIRGPIISA